jgi:hypothetical protein
LAFRHKKNKKLQLFNLTNYQFLLFVFANTSFLFSK